MSIDFEFKLTNFKCSWIFLGHGRGIPKIRGVHPRRCPGHPWQGNGGHRKPVRFLFRFAGTLAVQQIAADTIQSGRSGRGARRCRSRCPGWQRREPVGWHEKLPCPIGHRSGRLQRPPVRRPQRKRFVYVYYCLNELKHFQLKKYIDIFTNTNTITGLPMPIYIENYW